MVSASFGGRQPATADRSPPHTNRPGHCRETRSPRPSPARSPCGSSLAVLQPIGHEISGPRVPPRRDISVRRAPAPPATTPKSSTHSTRSKPFRRDADAPAFPGPRTPAWRVLSLAKPRRVGRQRDMQHVVAVLPVSFAVHAVSRQNASDLLDHPGLCRSRRASTRRICPSTPSLSASSAE
jgi:hypothetical protein